MVFVLQGSQTNISISFFGYTGFGWCLFYKGLKPSRVSANNRCVLDGVCFTRFSNIDRASLFIKTVLDGVCFTRGSNASGWCSHHQGVLDGVCFTRGSNGCFGQSDKLQVLDGVCFTSFSTNNIPQKIISFPQHIPGK